MSSVSDNNGTIPTATVINEVYDPSTSTDGRTSLKQRVQNLIYGKKEIDKSHKMLGEWHATSIAGNDISASCLYTAGICAQKGNETCMFYFYMRIFKILS